MKSPHVYFYDVVLSILLGLTITSCDGGWQYRTKERAKRVVLAANEVHEGWYFAAGDQVVIEGTVNGDAYVAGGNVEMDGTINGDLLVAGGMVIVGGKVSEDVRAAGGVVRISGNVGKDVSAAGGSVTLGRSGKITGNFLAACGELEVLGSVGREAKVASGDAEINGSIQGDLNFAGDYLSVSQGANVYGNLNAKVAQKERVKLAAGVVHGNVEVSERKLAATSHILGLPAWRFWLKVVWALGLLVVGLGLSFIAPTQIKKVGSVITNRLGETSLIGILGIIVVPVVVIMLCVTVIGIPAGMLLLMLFLALLYLSQFSLGIVLADRLFPLERRMQWSLFGAMAAGVVIVQILTFVPYVRFFVHLVSFIVGLGAILVVLKEEWQAVGKVQPMRRE